MPPPPPPPPPVLMREMVEEILLRVPPVDPASLVRAALVCKEWCRLVSGRGFRRRYRELHRTPPMLGFCYITYEEDEEEGEETGYFAPTTAFSPPREGRDIGPDYQAIDSRHGRVLLYTPLWDCSPFVIWDPITDEDQELPNPPPRFPPREDLDVPLWGAAVFCAASGTCDHLDCQRGSFRVVVACSTYTEILVYHYSSEAGAWSELSAPNPGHSLLAYPFAPGALVGNALYFVCMANTKLLKYNLGTRGISWIDGPHRCSDPESRAVVTSTGNGMLRFARVLEFKLHTWSCEVGPDRDARWTPSRVIDLAGLSPFGTLLKSPSAVGSTDDLGVIFLETLVGLFIFDLKSGELSKKLSLSEGTNLVPYVVPFMSFYTPALGMASAGGPNEDVSST